MEAPNSAVNDEAEQKTGGRKSMEHNVNAYFIDIDFKSAKKKRSSKKHLIESSPRIVANALKDEKSPSTTNIDISKEDDYTFDELLKRIYQKTDCIPTKSTTKHMRAPIVIPFGSKRSAVVNFLDIAKSLFRQPNHIQQYLLTDLGTSGSLDENHCLIIKGKFKQSQIQAIIARYIKDYVLCKTCQSLDTYIQKNGRLQFLHCNACRASLSVAPIPTGYLALTGKRSKIRAKLG